MEGDIDMNDFLGIHWAGLDRFILLPIFLVFILLFIKNYMRIKKTSGLLVHKTNRKTLFKFFSLKKQFLKTIFLSIAIMSVFLALLQPQWTKREQPITQEGRDLFIVLDISRSMLAQDMKPSRLEFAKLKIRNLLSRISFDRIGLILFSGTAFVQCPLTADHPAFLMFLDHVDVEAISSGTTALDKALSKTMDVFGNSAGRKNKLVLLITDGEDFSLQLDAVKQRAVQDNIRLFTLGVGTPEGAPIPKIGSAGYETDSSGTIALSQLNEKLLQDISSKINGSYIKATYGDSDIDRIAKLVKSFEKEKFADKKLSVYEDQYPWLLGIAWVMLMLEWIL